MLILCYCVFYGHPYLRCNVLLFDCKQEGRRSITMSGGYRFEVAEEVRKDFYCIICLNLMRDAMQLKCGHGMCNCCLESWEDSRKKRYFGRFTLPTMDILNKVAYLQIHYVTNCLPGWEKHQVFKLNFIIYLKK